MKDLTVRDLGARWWRPALVLLAVAGAVALRQYKDDLGLWPNVELLTATAFLAAGLLRHRLAALAPFVVVAISDLVLGNATILVFTWTAWAVVGLGSLLTRRSRGGRRRYVAALGFGVGGTAFFYLWTNFGVWVLGGGTWYPHTWDGLLAAYGAGLPFLRPQLLVNLALVPLAAAVVTLVERAERARVSTESYAAA